MAAASIADHDRLLFCCFVMAENVTLADFAGAAEDWLPTSRSGQSAQRDRPECCVGPTAPAVCTVIQCAVIRRWRRPSLRRYARHTLHSIMCRFVQSFAQIGQHVDNAERHWYTLRRHRYTLRRHTDTRYGDTDTRYGDTLIHATETPIHATETHRYALRRHTDTRYVPHRTGFIASHCIEIGVQA